MSDDKTEEIKRNILSASQWVRILYMAFYAIACWVVLVVVLPIIIACQILISLISGADNKNLREFGAALSDYLHQAINYLLYVSDHKPWPFDTVGKDEKSEASSEDLETAHPETVSAEVVPEAESEPAQAETADDEYADISFTEDADTKDDDTPKQ
jgi:hypothetical protein